MSHNDMLEQNSDRCQCGAKVNEKVGDGDTSVSLRRATIRGAPWSAADAPVGSLGFDEAHFVT